MNFKELLIAQGITEEQASKIIEAMPANKLYIASEENLDIRYNKAKKELEQAQADLTSANKLVEDLKKSNADVEALQKQVKEYEDNVKKLETERVQERKTYAIKEALTKTGALDLANLNEETLNSLIGKTISDKAYLSTTGLKDVAEIYGRGYSKNQST